MMFAHKSVKHLTNFTHKNVKITKNFAHKSEIRLDFSLIKM